MDLYIFSYICIIHVHTRIYTLDCTIHYTVPFSSIYTWRLTSADYPMKRVADTREDRGTRPSAYSFESIRNSVPQSHLTLHSNRIDDDDDVVYYYYYTSMTEATAAHVRG